LEKYERVMATIKDVALLAGVGVGTASRAISGNGAVSELALARVQAAVQQLNFRPSSVARALSLKQSGMIGVFVPVFEGSFYSPILHAIDAELRAADRHMMAASGYGQGDDAQQAMNSLDFLSQKECDGVLALSSHVTDQQFLELRQRLGRVVVLNRRITGMEEDSFSADHLLAGQLAARALLSRGHRNIASIQGTQHGPDIALRMSGFKAELALHGIALESRHLVDGMFTFASGYAAADKLLKSSKRDFTAVFCANDVMAMAAILRFTHAGLRVPQDISVMGYDDADIAHYTTPSLTTIHLPMQDVATNGCRHLLNQCYGLQRPVQRNFQPHVVWRDSVASGPCEHLLLDFPSLSDMPLPTALPHF
jgi:LacI family transcriptional regulator